MWLELCLKSSINPTRTSEILMVRRRKRRIWEKGRGSAFPLRWQPPTATVGLWGASKALLIGKQGLWRSSDTSLSPVISHEGWRRGTKVFFISQVR